MNSIWKEFAQIPDDYRHSITGDLSHGHASFDDADKFDGRWVLVFVECLHADHDRRSFLGRKKRGEIVGVYVVLKRIRNHQPDPSSPSPPERIALWSEESIIAREREDKPDEPVGIPSQGEEAGLRSGAYPTRIPTRSYTRDRHLTHLRRHETSKLRSRSRERDTRPGDYRWGRAPSPTRSRSRSREDGRAMQHCWSRSPSPRRRDQSSRSRSRQRQARGEFTDPESLELMKHLKGIKIIEERAKAGKSLPEPKALINSAGRGSDPHANSGERYRAAPVVTMGPERSPPPRDRLYGSGEEETHRRERSSALPDNNHPTEFPPIFPPPPPGPYQPETSFPAPRPEVRFNTLPHRRQPRTDSDHVRRYQSIVPGGPLDPYNARGWGKVSWPSTSSSSSSDINDADSDDEGVHLAMRRRETDADLAEKLVREYTNADVAVPLQDGSAASGAVSVEVQLGQGQGRAPEGEGKSAGGVEVAEAVDRTVVSASPVSPYAEVEVEVEADGEDEGEDERKGALRGPQ